VAQTRLVALCSTSDCLSNDFALSDGSTELELAASDLRDWKITGLSPAVETRVKPFRPIWTGPLLLSQLRLWNGPTVFVLARCV